MILDPDRYECPDHHADLTALVEEALEDHETPLAYRRRLLGRRPSGPRSFQVIVACPGATGGASHPLTCTGTQTP